MLWLLQAALHDELRAELLIINILQEDWGRAVIGTPCCSLGSHEGHDHGMFEGVCCTG